MGLPTDQAKAVSVQTSQVQSPKERKNKVTAGGTSCVNIQFVPGMFSRPPHHLLLLRVSCFSISIPLLLPQPPPFFYQMKLLCKKALAPQKNPKLFSLKH